MRARHFYSLVISLLASIVLNQASFAVDTTFNCKEAANFVEKTTCTNPNLLTLDQEIATHLETAEQITKVPMQFLTSTQNNWAKLRNQCKNTLCIETSYKNRLQELKNLNLMSQEFVQYFIRIKSPNPLLKPDQNFSALQIQLLEEKRVRILIQAFHLSNDKSVGQIIHFSGYANQGKTIHVKDLGTSCTLKLSQHKFDKDNTGWQIRQTSKLCGNKHLRFSGLYQLQK